MLAKVKDCGNAIKNAMAFDKQSNTFGTTRITGENCQSNSSILPRATTSVSSIPDIITFSSIALKHGEYEDVPILKRDRIPTSKEAEKLDTSVEWNDRTNDTNDSLRRFVSADNMISSSLKSFLALEKQVKEEFSKEEERSPFTIKKKISAEPFLSYTEGNAEFNWSDDTTEENISGIAWNSVEYSNSFDIGNPCTNSTFCEDSYVNKNCVSSPIRIGPLRDSGFENNFSV